MGPSGMEVAVGALTTFADDIVVAVFAIAITLLLAPEYIWLALLAVLLYSGAKVWLFRSHLARPAIGVEAMVGRIAVAREDLAPRGQVDLDGELWEAEVADGAGPVRAKEKLQVLGVEGLVLKVAPVGTTGTVYSPPRSSLWLGLSRYFRRS